MVSGEPAVTEEEQERWAHETPEEAGLTPVNYDRVKRWVMQRDGKDYIQFAGLLDLLHQESGGAFTISTHLEQAPTEANGMLAIVQATVTMGERTASGLGDAAPGSVNRMMAPHLVRMAETRAKGRCLRDLLNIPMVTVEELGPAGPVKDDRYDEEQRTFDRAAQRFAPDGIVINGTRYTRPQIWAAYQARMEQMKAAGLAVLPHQLLTNASPLPQLVGVTQQMRKQLENAGAAEPARSN